MTLYALSDGTTTLTEGIDYTVSNKVYTILSSYLESKEAGELKLTFEMDGGINPVCTLNIVNEITGAILEINYPAAGKKADTAAVVEARNEAETFTVTDISWQPELTAEGKFKVGETYTAEITLTAAEYEVFPDGRFWPAIQDSIAVNDITTLGTGPGNKVKFTAVYHETTTNFAVGGNPADTDAGAVIKPLPSVIIQDQYGHPISGIDVTVSEAGGQQFSAGTLIKSTKEATGIAVFDDLIINKAGNYQLTFTADIEGLNPINSDSFSIRSLSKTNIDFSDIVEKQETGTAFNIQSYISGYSDQYGNIAADGDYSVRISSPVDGEVFNGTVVFEAGAPAEPINIQLTTAGEHTLTIDVGSASDTAVVEVDPAVPGFTSNSLPEEVMAGEAISPAPAITVVDKYGTPVSGVDVTVSEAGGYQFDAGTLTRTTDSSGIAAFNDLVINRVAAGYKLDYHLSYQGNDLGVISSNVFTVTGGEVTVVVTGIVEHKTAGVSFDIQNQISGLTDQDGNAAHDAEYPVTVSSNKDGEVFNGVVPFAAGLPAGSVNIELSTAGEHILTVNVGSAGDTALVTVDPAAVDSLSIDVEPAETTAGEVINPSPAVKVIDTYGNPMPAAEVIVSEAGGYQLDAGSLIKTTDSTGIAVFDDLVINKADVDYQLNFAIAGVADISSDRFTVIPAVEADITAADMANQIAGQTFNIQSYLSGLSDQYGNIVSDGDYTTVVSSDKEGEVFNGSIAFADGLPAQEINITLTKTAEHTLTISIGAAEDTALVTVEPAAADSQIVSAQPGQSTAGQFISPTPAVKVIDQHGNPVSGIDVTVSETGGYQFDAGTLTRTTDIEGKAAFTDLMIEKAAEYQLTFSAAGLTVVNTDFFAVIPGTVSPANSTVIVSNSPQAAGDPIQIEVSLEDSYNNKVAGLSAGDFSFTYDPTTANISESNFDDTYATNGTYGWDITADAGADLTMTLKVKKLTITDTSELYWKSSAAEILSFSFNEQAGPISLTAAAGTIEVDVFNGSNINSLTPEITISDKASISPAPDTAQDFSSPVTYTVTAEDGVTTKDWTVTVTELDNILTQDEIQTLIDDGWLPVATAAELNSIRSGLNTHFGAGTIWEGSYTSTYNDNYIQVANIDMSNVSWSAGIGTTFDRFEGKYNGNGLSITGLYYSSNIIDVKGLFGATGSSAVLSNISLENVNLTADDCVGALVGINSGRIEKCSVSGTVNGLSSVGGLVGKNSGTIINSYSTADVSFGSKGGGLVGVNDDSVEYTYATGSVTNTGSTGSYGGMLVGDNRGSISNSYALSGSYPLTPGGTVTDSGLKTAAELKQQSTFANWDFSSIWQIGEGVSTPYFKWSDTPNP